MKLSNFSFIAMIFAFFGVTHVYATDCRLVDLALCDENNSSECCPGNDGNSQQDPADVYEPNDHLSNCETIDEDAAAQVQREREEEEAEAAAAIEADKVAQEGQEGDDSNSKTAWGIDSAGTQDTGANSGDPYPNNDNTTPVVDLRNDPRAHASSEESASSEEYSYEDIESYYRS